MAPFTQIINKRSDPILSEWRPKTAEFILGSFSVKIYLHTKHRQKYTFINHNQMSKKNQEL